MRLDKRPPRGRPPSASQSRGECQRTKSSSSAPGLAALKADMSEASRSPCSLAVPLCPAGIAPAHQLATCHNLVQPEGTAELCDRVPSVGGAGCL